jgi:hypothetical protein
VPIVLQNMQNKYEKVSFLLGLAMMRKYCFGETVLHPHQP